jgi:hypothetical protein
MSNEKPKVARAQTNTDILALAKENRHVYASLHEEPPDQRYRVNVGDSAAEDPTVEMVR